MESVHPHRGFTLIELLVVVAIIATIMGLVFTSQSSFNQTIVLANTAYDVALSLRSAETYGISGRGFGSVSNAGYGLHFQMADPGLVTLFADVYPAPGSAASCHPTASGEGATAPDALPGNCVYDASQGERVTDYQLGNGITVSNFCAYRGTSWSCASNGLSSLDIVFARPNALPFMSVNGSYSATNPVTAACLTFSSPQGGARYVSVSAAGEINPAATSCP